MTSPRPIRLAYLVSQYPAVNHTYILREIRGLRDLGFDVRVISIRPPDRPFDRLSAVEQEESKKTFAVLRAGAVRIAVDNLTTLIRHPLRYLSGLSYALGLGRARLFYLAEAAVAGRHLQRAGLTHFHSHYTSTVALLLAHVFPIECSMSIHGSAEFEDPVGFRLREKVAASLFVRAISDYGAGQLKRAAAQEDWSKIEVVRLGVDTSLFAPRVPPPETLPFDLLTVGSLAPPKAQALLIAAVDRLVRQGRDIRLRLAGDGPLRTMLETLVRDRKLQERVIFEGNCTQSRVQELYAAAGLFVLPSLAEGLPVVLMEAMAMEVPCLATNITGVPELIRHGVDGWLIPAGDEAGLAEAIGKLMDDPALRACMAKSGRARVQEHFELARNIERLAEVFRKRLSD